MLALGVVVIAVGYVLLGWEVAALKRLVLAQAGVIDSIIEVTKLLGRDAKKLREGLTAQAKMTEAIVSTLADLNATYGQTEEQVAVVRGMLTDYAAILSSRLDDLDGG